MAYEKSSAGNNGNNGFNQQSAQASFDAEAQQQASARNNQQSGVLRSIFTQDTTLLSRVGGGARLVRFQEEANKIIKDATINRVQLNALRIDAEQFNLFVPALALVGRETSNPGIAYVYVMMLEKDAQVSPEVKTRTNSNVTTVIPVVTGTAWDATYAEAVGKSVSQQLSINENDVRIVSSMVIPRDLDVESQAAVTNVLYNAAFAINTCIEEINNNTHFSLTQVQQNEVLSVDPVYSRNQLIDAGGLVKRADIALSFNVKTNDNNGNSLNGKGQNRTFGEIGAYLEAIMVQGANTQMQSGWGSVMQNPKFNPLLVVNYIHTEQAGSLGAQLAMLMTVATMAKNDEWVNSFYERNRLSRHNNEAIDIGEIGALNIEVNLPQYRAEGASGMNSKYGPVVSTRNADVTRDGYISLLQGLFNQDLFIALDCPMSGAESWYMDRFRYSYSQDEIGRRYTAQIQAAAEELTGGRFGQYWMQQGNQSIWAAAPVIMHNGYYINNEGQRRDIKDIDTLAVYNVLAQENPEVCAKWAATMVPGMDTEIALTHRKDIIEKVAGGSSNVVYTGYSARLMINPMFIKTLLQCANDIGFAMRFNSAYANSFGNYGSVAMNLGGMNGLNNQNIGGAFQSGGNNGIGNNGFAQNSFFSNAFGGSGLRL